MLENGNIVPPQVAGSFGGKSMTYGIRQTRSRRPPWRT